MLSLTRRVNQSITIQVPPSNQSQTIEIMVTSFPSGCGKQVRLGITANGNIAITRSELFLKDLNSAQKENVQINKEIDKGDL